MMSVDVFGRRLALSNNKIAIVGRQGPAGVGFQLTPDGNYDINNKRLCNIGDSKEDGDVLSLKIYKELMKNERLNIDHHLINPLKNTLEEIKIKIQFLLDAEKNISQKLEQLEVTFQKTINNLDTRLKRQGKRIASLNIPLNGPKEGHYR